MLSVATFLLCFAEGVNLQTDQVVVSFMFLGKA